ncbi:hypothetical protein Trydic_g8376 [Trypoxylus dichotomus]
MSYSRYIGIRTTLSRRVKFKQAISVRKTKCATFWDRQGVFLLDFVSRDNIVNAYTYCKILNKLRRVIAKEEASSVHGSFYFTAIVVHSWLIELKILSDHMPESTVGISLT